MSKYPQELNSEYDAEFLEMVNASNENYPSIASLSPPQTAPFKPSKLYEEITSRFLIETNGDISFIEYLKTIPKDSHLAQQVKELLKELKEYND